MDRCIASRAEWQALGEKSAAQLLELAAFRDLEIIHNDETSHGFYSLDWWNSAHEAVAQADTSEVEDDCSLLLAKAATGSANTPIPKLQDIQRENAAVAAQAYSSEAQSDAAQLRSTVARIRAEYENCNIDFSRRRTESARRDNATKALWYTDPNGPYNYEERRASILKRFVADFQAAQARLVAIREGMKSIYGYDLPVADDPDIYNKTLMDVRGALEWLARFSALEQNYVLPISVKCLTGGDWTKGLRRDGRAGAWEFPLPERLFPDQTHVRLRGLSACVDIGSITDFFQLVVRAPQQGSVRLLDGSVQQLAQQQVPVARICRVRDRDCTEPRDVVGTLALHNVSPISFQASRWRLVVTTQMTPPNINDDPSKASPDPMTAFGGSSKQLQDVILFLHVAVRSAPARRRSRGK